jgi:aspartyl-tRNA(Asn)/glutamyl-tRNA(Gln) amidotransferase subunit A
MQVIGAHFTEERLLNVAHRYQRDSDWHRHAPQAYR